MSTPVRVSIEVTTDQPELITRTIEALSRAVAGLAMDNVHVNLWAGPLEEEDEDDIQPEP